MMTNLAYAGSGDSTYGDTKTLVDGTGDSAQTFTLPKYYVTPATTHFTVEPVSPSVATDGVGQYGYLYNWCAAMGAQATSACVEATSPPVNPAASICPAGWRLPTGNGGEFTTLNAAVNGGSTSSDAGLRTNWLAQVSGAWNSENGFTAQGVYGTYWSSSVESGIYANVLFMIGFSVGLGNGQDKSHAVAVRCVTV